MGAIEITNLQKSFGSFQAVQGISFTVEEGEIFSLLGPNGAGKSTTISMLSGLLQPSGGDARIMGHSVLNELGRCPGRPGYGAARHCLIWRPISS